MATKNPFSNFYTDLLEESPQAAFQSAIPFGGGFSTLTQPQRRQRDYWSNQFSDIYNEYLGQQGQAMRTLSSGRELPTGYTGNFTDFLQNMPFTQRYGALTPQQKGTGIRSFSPTTRHIYF